MDSVTILGTRGSVPRVGEEYDRYGGDTTCVLVELAGERILLDAGTGLMNFSLPADNPKKPIPLLLSHFHTDHLMGLPLSPLLMDENNHLQIYARCLNGQSTETLLDRMFSPPLWPVRLKELPARIDFHELPEELSLGSVTVETIEGIHPDGVTLMKLCGNSRTVVFMPDCTINEQSFGTLVRFARGCDLLLCDGQYSDEEWASRATFGHSSWNRTAELGAACGAKRIRIIHHDPFHTDDMLAEAQAQLTKRHPDCSFAFANEEIIL